jgi:hypothetical protein
MVNINLSDLSALVVEVRSYLEIMNTPANGKNILAHVNNCIAAEKKLKSAIDKIPLEFPEQTNND